MTAVIVAFDPDAESFSSLLRAITPQVAGVVIVDNGGDAGKLASLLRAAPSERCVLIRNDRNVGLAAAQNQGIKQALEKAADYVLLLDHDSLPASDMVTRLVAALESSDQSKENLAAAGPVFIDSRSGAESRFVQVSVLGVRKVRCQDAGRAVVLADVLIASGMLVRAAVLRDVGMMDESLFVDHVDTDWCLRARAKGYRMLGVCAARMSHQLGDRPARSIAGRRFFVRSPARHYFFFRNSFLLYRRGYPPLTWKMSDALRLIPLAVAALLFCTPRLLHLEAIGRGVLDGLRGRSGPLPAALEH